MRISIHVSGCPPRGNGKDKARSKYTLVRSLEVVHVIMSVVECFRSVSVYVTLLRRII